MTNIISVPPELVEQWVDLLESHSDQAVFTLAAHWGYTQAVEELEEFLKKTVDTPYNNSMTDKQHPITPPPELVQQWIGDYYGCPVSGELAGVETAIAARAAQWGADQELEACCEWLENQPQWMEDLRAARRPKPPSLKEQAQTELDRLIALIPTEGAMAMAEPIRKALEALPND